MSLVEVEGECQQKVAGVGGGAEATDEGKVLLPAGRDNEGRLRGPPHAPRGHNHLHRLC